MNISTIRYPSRIGIKHAIEFPLSEDLCIEQWIVPKGTVVKTFQTPNFGFVKIPLGCQDVRGFTIPRSLFKY